MKNILLALILLSVLPAWGRGDLLLIGGGTRVPVLLKKIVELSKGNVLIVPYASEIPEEVAEAVQGELLSAGAKNVNVIDCRDEVFCLNQIKNTNLVFFTGGDQNLLLKKMKGTKAFELIQKRFADNLHLSGTSAGTAIMSEVMLTGSPKAPYEDMTGLHPNMVETTTGFGFVKKFIVDQHFLKRQRQNRLQSVVFDHPSLIGVGIDEATAIHIDANENFTVLGASDVMVYDARKANITVNAQNEYEAENVIVKRLKPGSSFRF